MIRHKLNDTTWTKMYTHLKLIPHIYVRNEEKVRNFNEEKVRNFVDAVHWRMKTGVSWRDLPPEFGKWNSIFRQFARWSDKGI